MLVNYVFSGLSTGLLAQHPPDSAGKNVGMPIYENCGKTSVQKPCMPDFTNQEARIR